MLVNEDMPSRDVSSRTACLDEVASSDVYLAIIGERGGWETSAGKLVVEEEYEEARQRELPVLVFLERTARDEGAEHLARRLSDYVEGHFRVEFDDPGELEREVRRAAQPLIEDLEMPSLDLPDIQTLTENAQANGRRPVLRLALGPERREEVISPVRLEKKDFQFEVYRLAHELETEVLSYERPKQSEVQGQALVITEQEGSQRGGRAQPLARLEIRESGDLAVDMQLAEPESDRSYGMGGGNMTVTTGSIKTKLRQIFRFCATLYDMLDEQKRHGRFGYNASVAGLGQRQIVDDAQSGGSGRGPTFRQQQTPVIAYSDPRALARNTLTSSPGDEVDRAALRLKRNSQGQDPSQGGMNSHFM